MGKKDEIKPFYGPPEETLDYDSLKHLVGQFSPVRLPHDEVTESDIRHWCEVMQDANPLYYDTEYARKSEYGGMIAPPAMVQTWSLATMKAALDHFVRGKLEYPEDPINQVNALLEKAGYTGVMATAQEQTYLKPIRPGDVISGQIGIVQISEYDHFTRQGVSRYYTIMYRFLNQHEEEVCNMTFRVLWYKPPMKTRKLYKG